MRKRRKYAVSRSIAHRNASQRFRPVSGLASGLMTGADRLPAYKTQWLCGPSSSLTVAGAAPA